MSYRVTISVSRFKFNRRALSLPEFKKMAGQELANTLLRLRKQISQGRGADGQEIKRGGYSAAYVRTIEADQVRAGATGPRKLSASPVNLTISGDLLNSMQVKETESGSQIYFDGRHYSGLTSAQLAATLEARGFENWFEYGQQDLKRIESRVEKWVDEQLEQLVTVERS